MGKVEHRSGSQTIQQAGESKLDTTSHTGIVVERGGG